LPFSRKQDGGSKFQKIIFTEVVELARSNLVRL